MPDTGTQQSLPFPRRSARSEPPDTTPLAAERAALHQRVEAFRHLIAYQGQGPAALAVIIGLQGEQIHAMEIYITALERLLRRNVEPGAAAPLRQKRPRRTLPPVSDLCPEP